MSDTCLLRSLEIKLRREIGRKSEGDEEGGEVLGIGMTQEFFQGEGKEPVEIERLKISLRGSEIEQAVDLSRRDGIPSGPGDVQVGREEMRRETDAAVHRRSSLQTEEGSRGATVGGPESTVKKVEKAWLRRLAFPGESEISEPEGHVRGGTESLFQKGWQGTTDELNFSLTNDLQGAQPVPNTYIPTLHDN